METITDEQQTLAEIAHAYDHKQGCVGTDEIERTLESFDFEPVTRWMTQRRMEERNHARMVALVDTAAPVTVIVNENVTVRLDGGCLSVRFHDIVIRAEPMVKHPHEYTLVELQYLAQVHERIYRESQEQQQVLAKVKAERLQDVA